MEVDDCSSTSAAKIDAQPFVLRSYQAEMVEESLKSNIIVVMDTGSGKTHIAIERSRAELETCKPSKRVWFLAPTVTLCEQQSEVFSRHLPNYNVLVLSGQDDVDHWTEQGVWDAVLQNVRIVLSTHQVLYDALAHAFVRIDELALIIFDEAHHCTLKHPANRIMSNFYTPAVERGDKSLPKVLGLSASPVMRADATKETLEQIERNMHAVAKTPKKSRSELAQHVHQPELIRVDYEVETQQTCQSQLLVALSRSYAEYDLMQDPYTKDILQKQQNGVDVARQLQKLFVSQKTYCTEQLKTLTTKSRDMMQELGPSAVDWYLHQCMARFERTVCDAEQLLDWSNEEKVHLLHVLRRLPFSEPPTPALSVDHVSQKVEALIDTLVREARDNPNFTGLVFVEQRVWVAVLAELLSVHPRTRDLFRVGTFLGTSQSGKRKAMIATFAEPKNQQTTLEDFRAGKINLILATSVLEEGIDVSSCHLVICFERPKNLKSFVQRRGRARMQESKYFVFMPQVGGGRPPESWEALEQEMKRAYLDDLRQAKLADTNEMEEEEGSRYFEVKATGARLTLDDALPHLNHFCALLGTGPYIDPRPQFRFIWSEADSIVTAEVTLPISVDSAVRTARSSESWRTEKMAKKDAAFEAYKALYLAGLVNDHLLPVQQEADDMAAEFQVPDHTPSMVPTSSTLDPWLSIAQVQQLKPQTYYRTMVEVQAPGEDALCFRLFTPVPVPMIGNIDLFWNESKTYTARFSKRSEVALTAKDLTQLRFITRKILQSIHAGRMQEERYDFLWLLAPCDSTGATPELANWDSATDGYQSAQSLLSNAMGQTSQWGLISVNGNNRKYFLKAGRLLLMNNAHSQPPVTQLQATLVPRRRDFLHRVLNSNNPNDAYTRVEKFASPECVVDNLPASYAMVALLLPSILHRIEVAMIAETLRTTLLEPVEFKADDLPLVVTALTASSTDEDSNYQRLEFLGDCILKFVSSLHVMAENPTWPESFLTGKKGKIVSNGFLARATLAAGLDKFVSTKRFTGAKWSPRYAADVLATTTLPVKQNRSSKLIADVVESLIGVGYIVGGFPKALACMQTLLPLERWTAVPTANDILYRAAPTNLAVTNLETLEPLIGYTFTKKMLLLEALTHASYTGPNAHCSYERLEFLGDAVLDYIISARLYAHNPPLPHQKMHAMRTAMANAAFLTFSMFETTIAEETINKTNLQPEVHQRALWQFLRSGSQQLAAIREVAWQQHAEVREQFHRALEQDEEFPWHLLALTNAPKFLSDIVESVIGAIYIDSRGDFSACEVFVRRLGILDSLERILRDNVDCLHPKERLGHLAVERSVQYVRMPGDAQHSIGLPPGMSKVYRCQVKVGGEDVGGVVEGLTRLNAETIAAWGANKILRGKEDVGMRGSEAEDVFFDADEGGGRMLEDW
ncbi:Dicer-like protein 2 [Ascochyta lentis]